jgi:hypothetical protein
MELFFSLSRTIEATFYYRASSVPAKMGDFFEFVRALLCPSAPLSDTGGNTFSRALRWKPNLRAPSRKSVRQPACLESSEVQVGPLPSP